MRRPGSMLALLVALLVALAGPAAAAPPAAPLTAGPLIAGPLIAAPACPAIPADLVADQALPRLAAALRPGGSLSILAIGSASTAAAQGYLVALRAALTAARPDLTLRLTIRAARGADAADGLRRLAAALAGGRYDLVLWQTGTVDAVRGARPDDLADTLEAGAEAVARHGASLVLIDPQFSHFLRANVDLEPYETVLRAVALRPDTALFPRTALMRDWADQDGIDPERAAGRQAERAAAARAQACVGAALAHFLLAAGPAEPAAAK